MYRVMKAIYDSGIPVSFKGSMVLKAFLMEAGYSEETRHTVDIDGNWNSDNSPTAEQMVESLLNALRGQDIDLTVSIYRMYGESRSAGFELTDPATVEVLFTMDVDVNRPIVSTKIYEVDGIRFRGIVPSQMITDKLSVVSSDKVFRRIKDAVDLYYLSKVFGFDKENVIQRLNTTGRQLDNFDGFLHRYEELEHSYAKFRFTGEADKPPFEDVYRAVKQYISDVLPQD